MSRTIKTVANNNQDGTWTLVTSRGGKILIDETDLDKAMRYSWSISKTGYAVANINGKVTKMHRYLLGIDDEDVLTDHINGNGLDNRRSNLRICKQIQNGKNLRLKKNNTSGHAGVRIKPYGRFTARIMVNRKEIWLGSYATFEEAVAARRAGELKYYGEFAPKGRNSAV